MRPDRVIAGFALIAILALVAVPGTVGHQTSLETVSAQAFQRVVLNRAEGTVASTFDPANRSASAVAASATLTEPADTVVVRARPAATAVSARGGTVAVPRPRITRPVLPASTTSRDGGGGAAGGGWRTSASSWYGPGLYGNGTACGQTLTKGLVGVAHKTLPCGTVVEFRNPANGRVVAAQVVDRGPYVAGRTWDLTNGLCTKLDHCFTAPIQWRLP